MKRFEDKKHLDFVASHGCMICDMPAEIHHLMHIPLFLFNKQGRRDDRWIIPLCPNHHRTSITSIHNYGDEFDWCEYYLGRDNNIIISALAFALHSPSDKTRQSVKDMVKPL